MQEINVLYMSYFYFVINSAPITAQSYVTGEEAAEMDYCSLHQSSGLTPAVRYLRVGIFQPVKFTLPGEVLF